MGALVAYFAAQATAAVRSAAISYGLLAVAALISIFAIGYAVDAGHTLIALRFGMLTASLIIAAALMAVAIGCGATAYFLSRRPRARVSSASSPYSHPPYPQLFSRPLLIGVGTGLVGAASLVALSLRIRSRRSESQQDAAGRANRHREGSR